MDLQQRCEPENLPKGLFEETFTLCTCNASTRRRFFGRSYIPSYQLVRASIACYYSVHNLTTSYLKKVPSGYFQEI
jgi:hypothetical protein